MKFKKIDEQYLKARKEFSDKYEKGDMWSVMDHWPLYVGNSNLQRFCRSMNFLKLLLMCPAHPRLMKGGLFIFDEWNHPKWPGETTAVTEFLQEHGSNYEVLHIKGTRQPTLALKKIAD
jgi:hypothetical protein